jgi:long-chain acyl-CoA synthetase
VSVYKDRPWLGLYRDGAPPDIEQEHSSMLELFRATVARNSSSIEEYSCSMSGGAPSR